MKKMNKKGFTLVELLAVIAILAILILLVTPNILKMFNEGKESVFVQQAQRVMEASNTKFMSVSLKNPGAYVFSNVDGATDTTNLNLTNDTIKYCVKMDNEGNVTYIHVSNETYSILLDNSDGAIKIDTIAKTEKVDGEDVYANLETNGETGSSYSEVKVKVDNTKNYCE